MAKTMTSEQIRIKSRQVDQMRDIMEKTGSNMTDVVTRLLDYALEHLTLEVRKRVVLYDMKFDGEAHEE